ncbi:hypothetical protein L228DRAFT_263242 [Xylona heveae TC161]|uniref:DUF7770 domain-containing protein n=1 Tax=Xylona heveae (strain CBS 132557 / TC161) TaxID=1328760 RepID=A0A165A3T5_XYLHT|nr:hypothetical protein L228DRAFT_263242 [Xylona heveae TC161]KZF19910.1 hypothetical protein L228DRAFT_263242 [Xylona heveae TC161]
MSVPWESVVVKVRFVVHTMGLAGWDKSRNHWSIFLVLQGESSSVRLNRSLANGSDENGTFSVTSHPFVLSDSRLTYFDYDTCPGLLVGHCLNLIYTKRRNNYRMTGSGNGCRFWVWTIFSDFEVQRYIPITPAEKEAFGALIQQRYHRSAHTQQIIAISDPMEIGQFL